MRKIIVSIILLAAGIAATTHGQDVLQHYSFPHSDHGIIREQNIAYYEVYGTGYFAHITSMHDVFHEMEIPQKWHVKDFCVLNDTVFFCGIDSSDLSALLGCFPASGLLANLDNNLVTIFRETNIGSKLTILNRIAAGMNKGTGATSLLAIGHSLPGIDPDLHGADHAVYFGNFPSNTTGSVYSSQEWHPEVFWEVTETENNMVLIGSLELETNSLTLHTVPIGTTATGFPAAIVNKKWYGCGDDFASGFRATPLGGDDIAISSYYKDPYDGDAAKLKVFTIDAFSGNMLFCQRFIGSVGSVVTYTPPLYPTEIAYQSISNTLMAIVPYHDNFTYILGLDPRPTGTFYVPDHYEDNNSTMDFKSLTASPYGNFMAAYKARFTLLDLATLPRAGGTVGCIHSFTTDIFTGKESPFNDLSEGIVYSYTTSFTSQNKKIKSANAWDCFNNRIE